MQSDALSLDHLQVTQREPHRRGGGESISGNQW